MIPSPLFTVVIPTYNRATFIHKTIESVIAQNFKNFEIVIIDDGSTDNTEAVVNTFSDHRISYYWKENGERGAARNEGARRAKGMYVNFLDSDDVLFDNHLSAASRFVESQPDAKAFHLGYYIRDLSSGSIRPMPEIWNINDQIISGNILSCNGVFVSRDFFGENSFIENKLMSSLEDWELWIRISSRTHFHQINTITSTINLHDERSVLKSSSDRIKLNTDLFIRHVSQDPFNQKIYSNRLRIAYASAYMYAALHLAMIGASRSEVYYYLRSAISNKWTSLLTKRFLVVIKLLLFPNGLTV